MRCFADIGHEQPSTIPSIGSPLNTTVVDGDTAKPMPESLYSRGRSPGGDHSTLLQYTTSTRKISKVSILSGILMNEDSTLFRDKVENRERWAGLFHKLLSTKSNSLDPIISELFPLRLVLHYRVGMKLPSDEMAYIVRGIPNLQAVGRDSLPAELLKLDHPNNIRSVHSINGNLWRAGKVV